VFPSTTLADGVAAIFGAFGVLAAHIARLREAKRGVEVVDVALFEGMFRLIPTQILAQDQLGVTPSRPGNFLSSHGVLRNLYLTKDARYLCISAVGPQAIRRAILAPGAIDLVARLDAGVMHEPPAAVEAFLVACNEVLTGWAARHTYDELARLLTEAGAVFNRVYDSKDIVDDPHYAARGDLVRVPDDDFESILMHGVVPKFPGREHTIDHAGRGRGADNLTFYTERLGLTREALGALQADGVI
jgi:formyl-CoA transferase